MSSPSSADYREACIAFIDEALKRPTVWFEDLHSLAAMMIGHQVAFEQLTSKTGAPTFTNTVSFHSQFSQWLSEQKKLTAAAGWAFAIEAQVSEIELSDHELFDKRVEIFNEYVHEFFEDWEPAE